MFKTCLPTPIFQNPYSSKSINTQSLKTPARDKAITVLGIDPGSRVTGVGVIRVTGNDLKYLYCESLKLPTGDLGERLRVLYSRLSEVIQKTQPNVVSVEKVFLAKNPQSALVLGHARGAAMLAAVNEHLPIVEYSATEIKKSVVGKGRADKQQVQHMMRVLLGLTTNPEEDAADALAAAVCHAHHMQYSNTLKRAGLSK